MTRQIYVDGISRLSFNDARSRMKEYSIVKLVGDWKNMGKLVIDKKGVIVSGYEGAVLNNLEIFSPEVKVENLEITEARLEVWDGALTVRKNAHRTRLLNLHVHHNIGDKMQGILVEDSGYCLIENCTAHNNFMCGIMVAAHDGMPEVKGNIVSGCISYANTLATGDSDGIKIHGNQIKNTLIEYCTVYDNTDDGIDTFTSRDNIVRYCRAFNQHGIGDGNGFKVGQGLLNIVENNIAYGNRKAGFTSNGAGVIYNNNVSYSNEVGFNDSWRDSGIYAKSYFINNRAYNNSRANFLRGSYTVFVSGNTEAQV